MIIKATGTKINNLEQMMQFHSNMVDNEWCCYTVNAL